MAYVISTLLIARIGQRLMTMSWENVLKSFGIIVVNRRVVNAAKFFCNHFRYLHSEQFFNTPNSFINNVNNRNNIKT